MSRDDDEAPDPRHVRGGCGGAIVVMLALALLLVVGVIGGGAFLMKRQAQKARLAQMEAELVAEMEAEEMRAAADRATEAQARAEKLLREPRFDGEQLDPIPVNLSAVTVKRAEALAGRLVLVTLDLLDNDDRRGGFVVYGNSGRDDDEGDDVERSVWVPRGMTVNPTGRYRGTLAVVRHHSAVGADGTEFPAWVEVRAVVER
jgi:hypothetical protein